MNQGGKSKHLFERTTTKSVLSYLTVIMIMSLSFSGAVYHLSRRALDSQLSSPDIRITDPDGYVLGRRDVERIKDYIQLRSLELLIALNIGIFGVGILVSYILTWMTLKPIKDSTQAQIQFVSDASHELRTPLATIQTMNEVALRSKNITTASSRLTFQKNIEQVIKLRTLTDSLLSLAKIENDTEFSTVNLADVVVDALNTVVDRALVKNIRIDDNIPDIYVNADQPTLTQAIVTLLDNAIKFSPNDSTVYVVATPHKSHIELSIKDEGPGVDPAHLPHIFDRFYKADESRTKSENGAGGYGIGLSLAKKLIEYHQGKISVSSELGKGATFVVELPRVKSRNK